MIDELAPDALKSEGNRVGLGVDLVEIARMRKVLDRTPRIRERAFTKAEREYCDSRSDPAKAYAVRFAAKEATVKALGTGFAHGIWLQDVEVRRNDEGKPMIRLSGRAKEIYEDLGIKELALSLSHTDSDAVAFVVALTEGANAHAALQVDPVAELASQFKQAKAFLDEI